MLTAWLPPLLRENPVYLRLMTSRYGPRRLPRANSRLFARYLEDEWRESFLKELALTRLEGREILWGYLGAWIVEQLKPLLLWIALFETVGLAVAGLTPDLTWDELHLLLIGGPFFGAVFLCWFYLLTLSEWISRIDEVGEFRLQPRTVVDRAALLGVNLFVTLFVFAVLYSRLYRWMFARMQLLLAGGDWPPREWALEYAAAYLFTSLLFLLVFFSIFAAELYIFDRRANEKYRQMLRRLCEGEQERRSSRIFGEK